MKSRIIFLTLILVFVFGFCSYTSAQYVTGNSGGLATTDLRGLVGGLTGLINSAIVLLVGIAVLFFIFGIIKYLWSADDAAKREEWRKYMIYGVIAMTVISGIWGIVRAVLALFGIGFIGPQFPTNF